MLGLLISNTFANRVLQCNNFCMTLVGENDGDWVGMGMAYERMGWGCGCMFIPMSIFK